MATALRVLVFLLLVLVGVCHAVVLDPSRNHVLQVVKAPYDSESRESVVYDSTKKSIKAYDESSTLNAKPYHRAVTSTPMKNDMRQGKLLGNRGRAIAACALPSERFNTRALLHPVLSPSTSRNSSFSPNTEFRCEPGKKRDSLWLCGTVDK